MPSALSRRRFLGGSIAFLAGASAVPLLSACGGGDSGGNVSEINALLITGGDRYPKYWETVTNAFKQQTGVTVNYDLLQFTPLTSKEITLAAARSTQYDVYSTHTAQIGAFFPHFEPLNNYFSASDLEDFFPVATKYLTNPANGELAAIPRNMDSRTQYYRTDLYEKSSLQPAKTWDELIDVSQKLTGGGQFGLVLPGPGRPGAAPVRRLLVAGRGRVARRQQQRHVQLPGRRRGADVLPRPHHSGSRSSPAMPSPTGGIRTPLASRTAPVPPCSTGRAHMQASVTRRSRRCPIHSAPRP